MASNTPHNYQVWSFEGQLFNVLIKDSDVYVDYNQLCHVFATETVQTIDAPFETAPGQWSTRVMISTTDIEQVLRRVHDIHLRRFWHALQEEYKGLPADKPSVASPVSHTKAFLMWRCIQAPGLLRVEDCDHILALLEDYICFPYRNDADIEIAMGLAFQIAEAPYEQSKITERLIDYLLGKEVE